MCGCACAHTLCATDCAWQVRSCLSRFVALDAYAVVCQDKQERQRLAAMAYIQQQVSTIRRVVCMSEKERAGEGLLNDVFLVRCSLGPHFPCLWLFGQEQEALAAARSEFLAKQRELTKQQAAHKKVASPQTHTQQQSSPLPAAPEQRQQRSPPPPKGPQQRSPPQPHLSEPQPPLPQQQQQQQQQGPSTVVEENVAVPSTVAAAAAAGLIGASL